MTTEEAIKTLSIVLEYTHIDCDYGYDNADGSVKLVPGGNIAKAIEMAIAVLRAQEEKTNQHPCINCGIGWGSANESGVTSCMETCEKLVAYTAQQERENTKPLTLDELREMDQNSPPTWDSCLNEWCAVRWIAAAGCKGVSYIGRGSRQLESGRFFRQKPKEV